MAEPYRRYSVEAKDTLKEHLAIETNNPLVVALQEDVRSLLDELSGARALHQEEQRRSADRLRNALERNNNG